MGGEKAPFVIFLHFGDYQTLGIGLVIALFGMCMVSKLL